jgi:signal transduction histidine kinase
MKPRSRRALVGVLSIAAVLLPAAGIAYLGAVSYREDRGIVAARLDEQFRAAEAVSMEIERAVTTGLDAVGVLLSERSDRPPVDSLSALAAAQPLAARPFRIDASGDLYYPATQALAPKARRATPFVARLPRTCPERGFDTCIRAMRAARNRAKQLDAARKREMGDCAAAKESCAIDAKDRVRAQRQYTALAKYDDTGPDALLGLARIARSGAKPSDAATHYRELGKRFGARYDEDGVSYALIADLGASDVAEQPSSMLAVYRTLVARGYSAPEPTLELIARRLHDDLHEVGLKGAALIELQSLDELVSTAHAEAQFAQTLASDIDDMSRSASERPRGRPSLHDPADTLVYRRAPDGGVIGVVVDRGSLERVAASAEVDLDRLSMGTRAVIDRLGESRGDGDSRRTLATAGFGTLLPHLTLALVNDRSVPDPLDEIVDRRGRRHLAFTGGLVALLVIGLIATIRGAARERELARLKSDFVSTVSHELKTPLTSIRMFGEMLQQGVAGTDRDREKRYQDIIVKESQRLGLLIANLLDYSQIERGTRRYSQRPERLSDITRDAVETFLRFREGEDAAIEVSMGNDCEPAEVAVDREVLVQSILNLLANAAKYGGPDKAIAVVVSAREPDMVTVAVTDKGPGIPASEQGRIFREFYRSPAAYSSGVEGTGLGLALVKRHVEAQGGQVELDSVVDQGSTFTLVFPKLV